MRRDDPPLFSPVATQRSGGEDKYGLIRPSSKIRKNTGHRPAASCRERQRLQRRYAGKNRHAGSKGTSAKYRMRNACRLFGRVFPGREKISMIEIETNFGLLSLTEINDDKIVSVVGKDDREVVKRFQLIRKFLGE